MKSRDYGLMPIYYEARMLIAQSQMEDVAILSDNEAFDHFDVRRFW